MNKKPINTNQLLFADIKQLIEDARQQVSRRYLLALLHCFGILVNVLTWKFLIISGLLMANQLSLHCGDN